MKFVAPLTTLAVVAVAAVEVTPTLDAGMVQIITLGLTTFGSIVLGYLSYKTAQLGRIVPKLEASQIKMEDSQLKSAVKIEELEKNTNSITKQLQESAGEIGIAKGKDAGRAELKAEQAQVAKGKLEAQEEKK